MQNQRAGKKKIQSFLHLQLTWGFWCSDGTCCSLQRSPGWAALGAYGAVRRGLAGTGWSCISQFTWFRTERQLRLYAERANVCHITQLLSATGDAVAGSRGVPTYRRTEGNKTLHEIFINSWWCSCPRSTTGGGVLKHRDGVTWTPVTWWLEFLLRILTCGEHKTRLFHCWQTIHFCWGGFQLLWPWTLCRMVSCDFISFSALQMPIKAGWRQSP